MSEPMQIEVDRVSVRFGQHRLLSDVSLVVRAGEVVAVLGASGSGKSTLLRVVCGLETPSSGRVLLDGRPIVLGEVRLAIQDDMLYENLDVQGNLGFAHQIARTPEDRRNADVAATARRMGITRHLRRRPQHLSGGERAAVSVGRVLAGVRHSFVALDEPLARADARRRASFFRSLRSQATEGDPTGILVATNDPELVAKSADRVIVLGGGTVLQEGPVVEVVSDPLTVDVAELVTEPAMNLIPASLTEVDGRTMLAVGTDRIAIDSDASPPDLSGVPILLGVRPAELRAAGPATPFDHVLHVTVGECDPINRVTRFGLGRTPGTGFVMATPSGASYQRGHRLEVTWRRMRLYRADTGARLES